MPSAYDRFQLVTDFELRGDQPRRRTSSSRGWSAATRTRCCSGVTGSGKTFTMAKVDRAGEPARRWCWRTTRRWRRSSTRSSSASSRTTPSSTSSATTTTTSPRRTSRPADIYIEKEATINDEIDRLRLAATRSLFERRDVIIVASVSCIYGLGSPEAYYGMLLLAREGRADRARATSCASWSRSSTSATTSTSTAARSACAATSSRSSRRTRSMAYPHRAVRRRDRRARRTIDPLTGRTMQTARRDCRSTRRRTSSTPRRAHARRPSSRSRRSWTERRSRARAARASCSRRSGCTSARCSTSRCCKEIGYCHGIENYSRHLTGRAAGRAAADAARLLPATTA